MPLTRAFAMLAPALLLLACDPAQPPSHGNDSAPVSPRPSPDANAPVAPASPAAIEAAGQDANGSDSIVPRLTPEAERGEKGARNVLLSFARAIEQREFEGAWGLLSPADKRKWTSADFAALFADLDRPTVAVPGGTMEGGAGSSYYTAPVAVTGRDREGRAVRIEGKAVLRRVNEIEGATPEQLRWRFEALTLDWTH